MPNNTSIDQLAQAISDAVRNYTEGVSEAIAKEVDIVAKEAKNEIAANSPKRYGNYAKGWTVIKENAPGSTRRIIWNKKYYRLVHLLEKGHAKVSGGRVAGKPHVGPAEQKYVAELTNKIEQIIRNGG